MTSTILQQLNRNLGRAFTPPRAPRTLEQFSYTMRLPDGPKAGEFLRLTSEPSQLHYVRAIDSGKWSKFLIIAPSQRGKTTIGILMPWMYAISEEELDVGYVLPLETKLEQGYIGKIKPGIIGSGFGSWLPASGPGSKGGKPAAIPFTNPITKKAIISYFMAAGIGTRETSLSSVSPARMMIDEVDDLQSAGQIELALKRLESWGSKGRAFLASTVNSRSNRESHPVLDFYSRADATQSRISHKCPHCHGFQIIQFAQLNLETSRVACSKCGVIWTEQDRHKALQDSEIIHQNMGNTEYLTLLTTIFDYNLGDFSTIAPSYLAAKDKEKIGDYSMAETFSHKVLCEPYTIPVDHETITDRMLTLRSALAKYPKGVVPPGADRIVVGVDVQGDRCYWVAVASGSADRRWIVDYDEWFWTAKDPVTGRPVEPKDEDRHAVLDRILQKARDGWEREGSDQPLKASLLAIDIGYNPNGSIGRWCFGKGGIVAVRGDHEDRQTAETLQGKVTTKIGKMASTLISDHGFYEIRQQEHTPGQPGHWWFVKSQSLREHVAARLRMPFDSEGALMLPHGIAEKDYLIQHLSAWAIVREHDSKIVRWVQIRKRDDYADATNYATALLSNTRRAATGGVVGKVKN